MDFKPVCLRVTFCNDKILVSVSPFKTILDLKKEVTRVYHLHYPQKAEECKRVQDSNGYLVCDDYQVGLVFGNADLVYALTAAQPIDKYSDQWISVGCSSRDQRISVDSSHSHGIDHIVNRQSHIQPICNNTTKGTPLPVSVQEKKHLNEQGSESETDCFNDLIPQVSEGNKLLPPPSQQINNLTTKSVKELNKTQPRMVFTDSSLSDSNSDTITISKVVKGGKTVGNEPKSTPKKKSSRKAVQEQIFATGSGDKTKDSIETRKHSGQKLQLAADANNSILQANNNVPQVVGTKKLRMKRRQSSDEAQGLPSEKKAKKKISKKELELANTSSQSMILDNEKLWTK